MSSLKNRSKDKSNKTHKEDKEKSNEKEKVSPNKSLPLRIFSRTVVIFSLLIIVYFTSKDEKLVPFAKQTDSLAGKGVIVKCSREYLKELDKFEGCAPTDCKRYVTDKIISLSEVEDLLEIANKGLKHGGSNGGASIFDLNSGALSKGQHFINIYKMDNIKKLFTQNDFNAYRVITEKIKYAIAHYFNVNPEKIYLTHPSFFSQITNKEAVTVHDEYWHPHVDKETYKAFHYTSLLYLSDYDIDFKGGRFVFVDKQQNSTVEPKKGRVSMFTSGSENLHYVEKVTSGVRYAITISFTCDKKYAIENSHIN